MDATLYINTTTRRAFATATSSIVPTLEARLQTHLLITAYFFAQDSDPALLAGSPTFRVALKDQATPSGTVLALLSAATATGATYYEFEWASIDSTAMRTLIGDEEFVPVTLEIEWTVNATVERVAVPVRLYNAWIRTADAAPDLTPFEASITAGGYLRLVDDAGDVWHLGLNSGEPPA